VPTVIIITSSVVCAVLDFGVSLTCIVVVSNTNKWVSSVTSFANLFEFNTCKN
jgi:hypothetical protein